MRERCGKSMAALLFGAMLFVGAKSGAPPTVHGFEWVPSPEEIQKYRRSWNPFSHGPILNTGVDIQPKGQYLIQPFVFGQVGHEQYGNKLTTDSSDAQTHLRAVAPTLIFAYGITNHVELNVAPSWVWFEASKATPSGERTIDTDTGPGDTTIYLKYRPIVQDPDTWRPSITQYNGITLPTSQWFGTTPIPGGFSPLGRLPGTKFGGLSFTEGVLFRKNLQPFRLNGGVYYTYTAPGSNAGMNTYNGDIVNTRFIVEYIADDKRGLGFNAEFLMLNGLPFRLDGHDVNLKPTSFSLIGVEPSIQYKFFHDEKGALVGAVGVLFSIMGQNDVNAIYPNISLYYYWSTTGKPQMR
ncbi:MAG: hypothetical protein AUI03_06855 [Nitrospirae bacterium 13_2_20CM_2_62_8]|nr:MAG: hypothetical protein AUI03_06855 [Nitrospirae bacterium 13_2_20CM_2_62_8]